MFIPVPLISGALVCAFSGILCKAGETDKVFLGHGEKVLSRQRLCQQCRCCLPSLRRGFEVNYRRKIG